MARAEPAASSGIDGAREVTPTTGRYRRYALAVLFALPLSLAHADLVGGVVKVSDGDTIRVLDAGRAQHQIRLAGIDAPERGQPFGDASRRHLETLLAGKRVRVESAKVDRYGRVVGKVWVEPPDCAGCALTYDANLAQVRAGMAWWYEYYAHEQPAADRESYKRAAGAAKRARLGLWSNADAVPPWVWRRGARAPERAPEPSALRSAIAAKCLPARKRSYTCASAAAARWMAMVTACPAHRSAADPGDQVNPASALAAGRATRSDRAPCARAARHRAARRGPRPCSRPCAPAARSPGSRR